MEPNVLQETYIKHNSHLSKALKGQVRQADPSTHSFGDQKTRIQAQLTRAECEALSK